MKSILLVLIVVGIGCAWYWMPAANRHHQAAVGTYFLRDYCSVKTPAGIVGWTSGQELHEVLKAPFVEGARTVTDGTLASTLPESMLTRDIEDAEALRLADRDAQEQTRNQIAAVDAKINANALRDHIASASNISLNNRAMVAASTVGAYQSRLNETRTYVGAGSVGYVGYPIYVSGSSAPASFSTGRASQSGVAAGMAQAQANQNAAAASMRQRADVNNARASFSTPMPVHTAY